MEILLVKIGVIWGIVLTVVRLFESVMQWWNTQNTQGVIQSFVQIFKNFFLDLETYKK